LKTKGIYCQQIAAISIWGIKMEVGTIFVLQMPMEKVGNGWRKLLIEESKGN